MPQAFSRQAPLRIGLTPDEISQLFLPDALTVLEALSAGRLRVDDAIRKLSADMSSMGAAVKFLIHRCSN